MIGKPPTGFIDYANDNPYHEIDFIENKSIYENRMF